ncbi:MAG: 4'-phosphopantetheinyl transferase superfamily protein [Marinobacter sp.]|uniref:4'-phosphopantetheinyl transferase family protein n=1 Tax=Marinobacter sp. TaxID=50741 RepID=UPI00299CE8D2|nr:4'-phosphopantetheinyl transferase superfamily protein [Marinobacter sp.]MDX1756292.1 4'-phosphopantetheinyl transferase superfamily protein [Marinobacter sp.]
MAGSSSACNPDSLGLWLARVPEQEMVQLPHWLSTAERDRAQSFHQTGLREFVHSRWLIRQALAEASGHPVDDCRVLAHRPVASLSPPGWTLSLSHSHGLAACAVSGLGQVGVDIEPTDRHSQWRRIVRRWFSPAEQDWLLAEDSASSFVRTWTLKEAWLKATGRGIAGNLQTLQILPGHELRGDRPEPDWRASLGTVDDHTVALVYRAGPHAVPSDTLLKLADGMTLLAEPCPDTRVHWLSHTPILTEDRS